MTTHPPAEPLPGIVDPERGLALPLFDIADQRPAPTTEPAHPCPACGRPLPHHHLTECRPCRDHGINAAQLEPEPEPPRADPRDRLVYQAMVAAVGMNCALTDVDAHRGAVDLPADHPGIVPHHCDPAAGCHYPLAHIPRRLYTTRARLDWARIEPVLADVLGDALPLIDQTTGHTVGIISRTHALAITHQP